VLLANIKAFWEPLRALLAHMEELDFIRPTLRVEYLVADRIEDVVPMLMEAAAQIAEAQKTMAPEVAGRM
jgi:predicted Rossmann-fold nucleotide-binding protein